MIYIIPIIFQTITCIFCLNCTFRTLANFASIRERLESLQLADAEWMACAQRKANLRNIADAYAFISRQKPHLIKQLIQIREQLEHPLYEHNNNCIHTLFPNIHGSTKKQNPRSSHLHWPNWIHSAKEILP